MIQGPQEELKAQGAARSASNRQERRLEAAVNWVRTRWYRPGMRVAQRWLGGRPLLREPVRVEEESGLRERFEVLHAAEVIDFGDPAQDRFLRSCQYIQKGKLARGNVFVCTLQEAVLYPRVGLVLTRRWQPVLESVFDLARFYNIRRRTRPLRVARRGGTVSSVQHLFANNHWHWTVDSLAQVWSLERYMQGKALTLLMPDSLPVGQREHLEMLLPENFRVEYVAADAWVRCEHFVLPSYVSSRANGFLPDGYYGFLRERVFRHYGIERPAARTGRYYISRTGAAHRRVLNEDAVLEMLTRYGFECVRMEQMTFAEQVRLMRGAECLAGPHGAGLGCMVYGEELKVLVLYPEAQPAGYFYTMARGLGHRHFQTNADALEDDDFVVDLRQLEAAVKEMGLGVGGG